MGGTADEPPARRRGASIIESMVIVMMMGKPPFSKHQKDASMTLMCSNATWHLNHK